MITVFHMNDATWEQSIPHRFGNGNKLFAFHSRVETKLGMDKVAEVDTDDLNKAYELTNNINDSWVKNAGVKAFGAKGHRSTDVGDVMFDGTHAWVVAGCGFINLDTGKEY